MEFTWQVAVVVLGGMTAFLSFLYAMLKKDKGSQPNPTTISKWKSDMDKEHVLIKEQIVNIRAEVAELKKNIQYADENTQRTLEKFENKIEKFTDIIIDYIRKD
jgi:hypothetical protein